MKQNNVLDSATERVNYDSSSTIDAQATTTVADLAMEIGNPNLETLATVKKLYLALKFPIPVFRIWRLLPYPPRILMKLKVTLLPRATPPSRVKKLQSFGRDS